MLTAIVIICLYCNAMWWAGGKAEPRNTPPTRTPSPVSTNEMHRLPLQLFLRLFSFSLWTNAILLFGINLLMRRERGISKADWRSWSGRGKLVYHVWRQPGSRCPVVTRYWWTCILMPSVVGLCSKEWMLHCTAGKKRGLEDLKVVFTYYYKIIATRIDRKQTSRDWWYLQST